jgi:hypothetical protein
MHVGYVFASVVCCIVGVFVTSHDYIENRDSAQVSLNRVLFRGLQDVSKCVFSSLLTVGEASQITSLGEVVI